MDGADTLKKLVLCDMSTAIWQYKFHSFLHTDFNYIFICCNGDVRSLEIIGSAGRNSSPGIPPALYYT